MTTSTTSGWAYDLPNRRTRLKSVDLVRRNLRFTRFFPEGMLAALQEKTCSSAPQVCQCYQTIRFVWLFLVTVKRYRPLARRALITLRPSAVDMRERKPWTRTRRRILGWYVRFGMLTFLTLLYSFLKRFSQG
jgi:hypothetical protein